MDARARGMDRVKWMLRPDAWIRGHPKKLIERAEGINDKKKYLREDLWAVGQLIQRL